MHHFYNVRVASQQIRLSRQFYCCPNVGGLVGFTVIVLEPFQEQQLSAKGYPNWFRNGQEKGAQTNNHTDRRFHIYISRDKLIILLPFLFEIAW